MRNDRPATRPHSGDEASGAARPSPEQVSDDLQYIRSMMEQSGRFTAVPGWGSMAMGATALVAALYASTLDGITGWLAVWDAEAVLAAGIGATTLVAKARRQGIPLRSGPARKFVFGLLPPLAAGAVLTLAVIQTGEIGLLPGLWLCCYGAATMTAGAFSVRTVPAMGTSFLALGTLALFVPPALHDVLLAAGFGGLHLIFGIIIAQRHGG